MFVRLSFILYTIAKMTRFVEFADGTCKNYRFASNPASGKVVWNNSTLCSHYRDGWRTKERVSHVRKQQQHHTYTPRHTHSPSNKHVIQQPATKYFFFFTWKRPWASYCTWKRKGYSLKQAHITLVMTRACMHSSSTKDTLFQNQHTPLVNAPEGKRRQKNITSKRDKWTSASGTTTQY